MASPPVFNESHPTVNSLLMERFNVKGQIHKKKNKNIIITKGKRGKKQTRGHTTTSD